MKEKHIHFIGIGGVGMVGLALIMHEKGYYVSGSDMTTSKNSDLLLSKNIKVVIGHSEKNISSDKDQLIVRSSAIQDNNIEFKQAQKLKLRTIRRGEMLAEVATGYKKSIAITGTHGKTSVTALLVHILKESGTTPGYMIGGKIIDWESSAAAGDGSIFITESDESDGTQVHLKSDILVITNIEDDHSWSVGGSDKLFSNFATIARNSKEIIYNHSSMIEDIIDFHSNKGKIIFNPEIFKDKSDWGNFQKENANIAVECAVKLGIDRKTAICDVRKFPGVERRMSTRFSNDQIQIIEDYAHHPTEVAVAIETFRERFPNYNLKIIFQPHRYARLEKYLHKFALELNKADQIYIVPVFAAWSETGSVTSADLAKLIGTKATNISGSYDELAMQVSKSIKLPRCNHTRYKPEKQHSFDAERQEDQRSTTVERKNQRSTSKGCAIKPTCGPTCGIQNREIIAILGAGDIDQIINPLINIVC